MHLRLPRRIEKNVTVFVCFVGVFFNANDCVFWGSEGQVSRNINSYLTFTLHLYLNLVNLHDTFSLFC